eukprot:gene7169-1311_t
MCVRWFVLASSRIVARKCPAGKDVDKTYAWEVEEVRPLPRHEWVETRGILGWDSLDKDIHGKPIDA